MHHAFESMAAFTAAIPAVGTADFSGHWRNDAGGGLTLVVADGFVEGDYHSHTPGGDPVLGEVRGFTAHDLLVLAVCWPGAGVTALLGQIGHDQGEGPRLRLLRMATDLPDPAAADALWSLFAGAELFHR